MITQEVDGIACVLIEDTEDGIKIIRRLSQDVGREWSMCGLCPRIARRPACQHLCGSNNHVLVEAQYVPMLIMRGAKFDEDVNG